MEAVYYLGEALKYGEIKGTWKDGTFDFIIAEDTAQNIKSLEDKSFDLNFVAPATAVIFKREFQIPKITITFKNAQVKDLDKVKKKAEVLEDGDVMKVTFVAKGDNQYIEQFDFEQSV